MSVMKLIETLMLWCSACISGIVIMYQMIRQGFKKGFGTVFRVKQTPRPACLDDPTLGTHGFLELEDVRIHYVASGPEDKPLMLFLHGFPEFWFSWRHQIREFQKDYRTVAIDMRGYGESSKPTGIDAYESAKLAGDIKKVILGLGYKSCVLVAHDWGGAVAWFFGRHFPDLVDRLIIMNAPPNPIFQKLLRTNKAQQKMSWYMFFFQLPYLPEMWVRQSNFAMFDMVFNSFNSKSGNGQEEIDAYKYTYSQPGAVTPPINYYRAAFRRRALGGSYDMDYVIPVLLVWGCKDAYLTIEMPNIVERDYPKITVKRIAEGGHFVQMDTPELVNSAMREWLDEQNKA